MRMCRRFLSEMRRCCRALYLTLSVIRSKRARHRKTYTLSSCKARMRRPLPLGETLGRISRCRILSQGPEIPRQKPFLPVAPGQTSLHSSYLPGRGGGRGRGDLPWSPRARTDRRDRLFPAHGTGSSHESLRAPLRIGIPEKQKGPGPHGG